MAGSLMSTPSWQYIRIQKKKKRGLSYSELKEPELDPLDDIIMLNSLQTVPTGKLRGSLQSH